MKKTAVFLLAYFMMSICLTAQRPKDKIIINKRPTNTSSTTTSSPPANTQQQFPKTNNQQSSSNQQQRQDRVKHDYSKQRDHLELRYTVQKTNQDSKHTYYRIIGNIYSDNLTEALFNHNRRIVLFQIDNWESGFFGDKIESIDGYATNQLMNQQSGGGPLYQFGNSAEREFSFDFKVKKGRQPAIKVDIYPDWKVYKEYEPYLAIDFATLTGSWIQENNPDVKFDLQFSPQGNQIIAKDLIGQTVTWTIAKDNSYVREIGSVPQQTQTTSQNNNPKESSTDAPPGGYLGGEKNSTTTNNNTNGNTNQPDQYPPGGYLGGDRNSNNGNGANNTNSQNTNNQTQTANVSPVQAYKSIWQIVDRTTLKYYNSEGIVLNFKKGE